MRRIRILAWLATAIVGASSTSVAHATPTVGVSSSDKPVLVTSPSARPFGFNLTARWAERIAGGIPLVQAELRHHPRAVAYEYTKGSGRWQVSWFDRGREVVQVYVDDLTGKPTEAWTGYQVAWTMARGYPGAFGHKLNHAWIWVPLCVAFLLPFARLRRRRPSLLQLDLLMLLGFSISLAFFNNADLGMSVPLAYPFLLYLLVRMLLLAFGRGRPRAPLRLLVPVSWIAVALVALVGFRIWMNVSDSGVIDVGYAGVIGADRLVHGKPLYGNWPADNATGDTYGPVNYYAYVPFRQIWGWSGHWDQLPAGHAAAIAFDLLTMLGLFMLGRRVRGPTLGILLAYAWASYPFTLYALQSNGNDALVSFLLVLTLIAIASPPARGVFAALSGFAKFAPFLLAPLLLRGTDERLRLRRVASYVLAFAATSVIVMAPVLLNGGVHTFWRDTVVRQFDRSSPFSVWGLWGGLGVVQHIVQGAAALLAIAVVFVPRRREVPEVAALGAAVLIAFQLGLTHWFYLYIVWFFPFIITALLASTPRSVQPAAEGPVLDERAGPVPVAAHV